MYPQPRESHFYEFNALSVKVLNARATRRLGIKARNGDVFAAILGDTLVGLRFLTIKQIVDRAL